MTIEETVRDYFRALEKFRKNHSEENWKTVEYLEAELKDSVEWIGEDEA